MKKFKEVLIMAFVVSAACFDVPADSWRCGSSELARTGDSYAQVISACGYPDAVDYVVRQERLIRLAWYTPAYGQQPRRLEFIGGQLAAIEIER